MEEPLVSRYIQLGQFGLERIIKAAIIIFYSSFYGFAGLIFGTIFFKAFHITGVTESFNLYCGFSGVVLGITLALSPKAVIWFKYGILVALTGIAFGFATGFVIGQFWKSYSTLYLVTYSTVFFQTIYALIYFPYIKTETFKLEKLAENHEIQ